MADERQFDNSALAVIGSHCPHCPLVLDALTALVKTGELGSLEIINLESRPEAAAELGVRSVPWVRIGRIELFGLYGEQEYRQWVARAGEADQGMRHWLEELLGGGEVARARRLVDEDPALLEHIVDLLGDADAKINLRLGVGVIMEDYAADAAFEPFVEALVSYTRHPDARVRADACHYLALTGRPAVLPVLEKLLQDDNAEVREVAADGIEELRA